MVPKLTGKGLPIFLVFILFFVPLHSLYAQVTNAVFQVIHLPRKAGFSKAKLNTELATAKDKEAVKKILRAKNFPSETTIVIFINRPNIQPVK